MFFFSCYLFSPSLVWCLGLNMSLLPLVNYPQTQAACWECLRSLLAGGALHAGKMALHLRDDPKTPTAWFPRRKKIGGKGLFHMPFLLLNLWLWINPVFYAERNEWKRGMSEKEDWGPENCILGFSVKTKQSKTTKQNTRVREEMHPCSTRIGSEACLSFSGKVPIPHSCVCVCLPALLMVWFTMW